MERKGKGGWGNWIRLTVFLLFVLGSPLSAFLAGAIRQSTGVVVSPTLILGGLVILAVAASLISAAVRSIGRLNRGNETRLPSSPVPPPQMSAPPRPSAPPLTRRDPGIGPAKLPGSPQFDPIIDPRILTIGIVGLVLFGGAFLVILALSGGI